MRFFFKKKQVFCLFSSLILKSYYNFDFILLILESKSGKYNAP